MSGLTSSKTEAFYNYVAASTQLNTFTTEDNLQKTYPSVIIPPGFFSRASKLSTDGEQFKSIHIRAFGRLGSTATPAFTFKLRALTSPTWSAGGLLLSSSNAITAGSGVTLQPFFLDIDVTMKSLGVGAASTIETDGEARGAVALGNGGTFPAGNTDPTVNTWDDLLTYYLFLSVACGTSNALNLIQLERLKVYGDN